MRRLSNPKSEIPNPKSAQRRGSVLIVVIGLLLLLMLIGFAFFTFANQEHSSSEFYADSAKYWNLTPNTDTLFNFALEQLIIGPHNANNQSALWPGDKSLVPNMLGMFAPHPLDTYNADGSVKASFPTVPTDRHAFNGSGLNITSGYNTAGTALTGAPVMDQDFNGIDDNLNSNVNRYLLAFNHSGAAQFTGMGSAQAGSTATSPTNARISIFNNYPAIDVGYTYADINNAFLAYIGTEPVTGKQVVKPSFHHPALLRYPSSAGTNAGKPNLGWQNDASGSGTGTDTTVSVLRPHPAHLALFANGTASTYPRFLSNPVTYQPSPASPPHTIQQFPFLVDTNGPDSNGNITYGEQGLWTSTNSPLEYDVDNDGDGTREGIWVDLGGSMTVLSDGRKMVQLYSFTVTCGDGLINLNTAGNLSWLSQSQGLNRPFYGSPPGYAVTGADPISHSNLGLSSPAEINPFWALVANPNLVAYLSSPNNQSNGPAPALQQYRGFFGLSNTNSNAYVLNDAVEMANMDMIRLLWGAPNYNVTLNNNGNEVFSINNIVAGRWGDITNLLSALGTGNPGSAPPQAFNSTTGFSNFPLPGIPYVDDDGDLFAGLTDAGYVFNNSALGYNQVAMGGDPTVFLLPIFGQGHLLQAITGPIGNQSTLYPSMISQSNAPPNSPVYNSPVTVLPFGQPLDFTGAGTWTNWTTLASGAPAGNGQFAYTKQPNGNQNGMYLYYNGYSGSVYGAGVPASPIMPYQMAFAANSATAPYLYTGSNAGGMSAPYYASPGLMANTNFNGLIDEPDETVSISAYAQSSDQTFPVDDTAGLALTQTDYAAAVGQSRVRQLAAFNFELNLQAAAIRQRFTTVSSDRRNHGFASAVSGPNGNLFTNNPSGNLTTGARVWEYNNLSGGNNINNWDGTGVPQFPPMVLGSSMDGQVPAQANNPNPANSTTTAEPFRMELAALIGAKLNNNSINGMTVGNANAPLNSNATLGIAGNFPWYGSAPYEFHSAGVSVSPWQQQQRLNINRMLTVADPNFQFGHSSQQTQQNPLRYRELTPHPTMAQWGTVASPSVSIGTTLGAMGAPATSGANAALQFPSAANNFTPSFTNGTTGVALQEYWARRDRQQMARDIYVMLYMFGGGQDSTAGGATPINYATTPNQLPTPTSAPSSSNYRPVYQDWQLAEMAQFAVNVVDSLDRDDTITMFEYDKDLSDGWNLDDDPITTALSAPTKDSIAAADRGIVFGVEAQQLAFNEALVIVSRLVKFSSMPAVDHGATPWDDSKADHTFTFLELYNVGPYPVPMANGNWQIVTLDPTGYTPAAPNLPAYANLPLAPQQLVAGSNANITVPGSGASGLALSALTLQDGNAYGTGSIPPGSAYTIGSRTDIGNDNATGTLPSTFSVDPKWTTASGTPSTSLSSPTLTQMVPQYVAANPAGSTLNLDLLKAQGSGTFVITDYQYNPASTSLASGSSTSAQGAFYDMTTGNGDVTQGKFGLSSVGGLYVSTFVLRRRLNLNRPTPGIVNNSASGYPDESDNPFIEVDRITYSNYNPQFYDPATPPQAIAPFPNSASTTPPQTVPPVDPYVDPTLSAAGISANGPAAGAFFNLRDPTNDTTLGGSTNAASCDIQPKLARLVSKQRRQPLDGYEAYGGSTSGTPATYPIVWPNWPGAGTYAPSTTAVKSFVTSFPVSRAAYYQNHRVCYALNDTTFNQYTPFPAAAASTNLAFSPNTFGQPNQYLPSQFNGTGNNNGSNSNGAPGAPFTLWQPHFDRDFASIGELLSVPLYGPSTLTQSLAPKDVGTPGMNGINLLASEAPLPPTQGGMYQPLVAQAKFFRPQHPLNSGVSTALQLTQFDNRWHRVLELLDVPSRANMQIENNLLSQYPWLFPQALQRAPGKINLNTLRHGENLFALLDDPAQFNVLGYNGAIANNSQNGYYTDNFEGGRNWWQQMLNARDGYDWGTGAYMPGSPSSRPFRPLSFFDKNLATNTTTDANNNSAPLGNGLDDTLLRTLPGDAALGTAVLDKRGLFEARTQNDLSSLNSTGGNVIDYYTRQRLLSKIAGNTTQRSNVFLVWISVGFFEAYQPDPTNNPAVLQIGAEMTDQSRRRGFFIVDRSMLEDAWVPDVNNPQNGYYDYSKFILYRKTLQ